MRRSTQLAIGFILASAVAGIASCSGSPLDAQSTGPQGPAGPQGPQGPAGPAGSTGAQGPTGPAGTNGVSGYEVVTKAATIAAGPNANSDLIVSCPSGKKAIGGGVEQNSVPAATMYGSYPGQAAEGPTWHIALTNGTTSTRQVALYAVCVIAS